MAEKIKEDVRVSDMLKVIEGKMTNLPAKKEPMPVYVCRACGTLLLIEKKPLHPEHKTGECCIEANMIKVDLNTVVLDEDGKVKAAVHL